MQAVSYLSLCCAFFVEIVGRPNLVFLLTDDEDFILHSHDYFPHTRDYFVSGGMELRSMYATTPMCCPSRSGFLTGRYIHNINVVNNTLEGNCSSKAWQEGPEKQSFAVALEQQGYRTGYFGKYLNGYGSPEAGKTAHVPPGWTEWQGLKGNSQFYNYTLSVNGEAERHGDDYATDYLTDLIKNRSLVFIRTAAQRSVPFFAMLAPPAAHDPTEPAPQYASLLADIKAPRTPNYGCAHEDKHWFVRAEGGNMSDLQVEYTDLKYRRRVLTLLSVGDLVEDVVSELSRLSLTNNTYIFYTSDNGYHTGQFGIMKDKRLPYETDTRLPGYVLGPTVRGGSKLDTAVLNIDFAPTFLELAGVTSHEEGLPFRVSSMDGRSFADAVLHGPGEQEQRSFLLEYNGEGTDELEEHRGMRCNGHGYEMNAVEPRWNRPEAFSCSDAINNTYRCVRRIGPESNSLFCIFPMEDGFLEYFPDIGADPWQVKNRIDVLSSEQVEFWKVEASRLATCKDESCRSPSGERAVPGQCQGDMLRQCFSRWAIARHLLDTSV